MARDDETSSPLLLLLGEVEKGVHLRRRDLLGRIAVLQDAVARYARAIEEVAAVEYARSHGLKIPKTSGISPGDAAQTLLETVSGLPELLASGSTPGGRGASLRAAEEAKQGEPDVGGPQSRSTTSEAQSEDETAARPLSAVLPRVARACQKRRLVIVGALSGRRKKLPAPLDCATQWIDTADGGRAASAVPTRIKQGGLFAVIICDQSVSHQHSEPLVAAARAAGVPVGFAGKGGAGAIARALEAIEDQLSD